MAGRRRPAQPEVVPGARRLDGRQARRARPLGQRPRRLPLLQTTYDGKALDSRDRAVWQVRVWDVTNRVGEWSTPATFEIGLLSAADWQADWITNPEWVEPLHQDVKLPAAQTARYVQLKVTDLGRPEEPLDDPGWRPRLELGELVLRDSSDPEAPNLAQGAKVTASENKNQTGVWNPSSSPTASSPPPRRRAATGAPTTPRRTSRTSRSC